MWSCLICPGFSFTVIFIFTVVIFNSYGFCFRDNLVFPSVFFSPESDSCFLLSQFCIKSPLFSCLVSTGVYHVYPTCSEIECSRVWCHVLSFLLFSLLCRFYFMFLTELLLYKLCKKKCIVLQGACDFSSTVVAMFM